MIYHQRYPHLLKSRQNHHQQNSTDDSSMTAESEDDRSASQLHESHILSQSLRNRQDNHIVENDLQSKATHNYDMFEDKCEIRSLHDTFVSNKNEEQKQNIAPQSYERSCREHASQRCKSKSGTLRDITTQVYRKQLKEKTLVSVSVFLRRYTSYTSAPIEESFRPRISIRFKIL